MLSILTRHLERIGYRVHGAGGGGEALETIRAEAVDIVLSDIRMPGMDGRTLLQVVTDRYPEIKVVLMTAFGSVDAAVEAVKAGAYSYICKPFKVEEVAEVLSNAAGEIRLRRATGGGEKKAEPRCTAARLIGRSKEMEEVRRFVREAAPLAASVLITGRSGTGKELAARAIHFEGPRAEGPFVPVNCAAIPETLFESEMFGYRRGAFSGADRTHVGLVEQSCGGTLFLDEVAEIPPPQQAKLLRVIQEREVRPLGGREPTKLNLRVICATNRSLEAMVRRGDFREDLYYRLNVIHIRMPELADVPGDIAILAEHLLVEIAGAEGMRARGFPEEVLTALGRYPWPGNVRELRNVIERAFFHARGLCIETSHLPGPLQGAQVEAASPSALPSVPAAAEKTLMEVEKDHIERVLAECNWNRSAAARILGIDRRTLFSKIQRYGLVGPLK